MSEQPPQQPNNFDVQPPNGQPLQPLSPEALTQRTAEATLHKLEAEAKLVDVQLQQAQRANEAATREARAWHTRYSFVPPPQLALQAVGAGIVLVLVFFTLLFR